jgi:hypothetical protein
LNKDDENDIFLEIRRRLKMAENKSEPMGLGMMIVSLSIVGFIFAGPGWYMWAAGPKIAGGIFLGITALIVLVTLGSGPLWRAFIAYIFGSITTALSLIVLTAIFGTP